MDFQFRGSQWSYKLCCILPSTYINSFQTFWAHNIHFEVCRMGLKWGRKYQNPRIILGDSYVSYDNALELAKLKTLEKRREELCLNFAKSCLRYENTSRFFPLNPATSEMDTRDREKYLVQRARTERLAKSAIPYMQRLLNQPD